MAPPTEKQAEILKQFREHLEEQDLIHDSDNIGTDDATLLRFLRARQFDVKAATTMWENCQNWRNTYPERPAVFECWPLWFHKTDKKGRPLNIHHFGGINMPELYKHITPERFWQHRRQRGVAHPRGLPASARAAGHQIDGTFVIVDLKGFGLSQFWQMKNLARDSFQISQDYFPETMAQLAIINAPASFTTIWSFIKPWLAKETLAKIDILGTNYQDVLLEQIAAENLPESLGGTCTCAEAGGCKLSNAGPWMQHRKIRREKWLRGERTRMGLGMEGEDEDDGVRGIGSDEQTKAATNQLEKQAEAVATAGQTADKEPAEVPPEVVQNPQERLQSFAAPEPSLPANTATYEKSTEVVAEQDTALKPASPPALSPSASASSSSASSSSFQSARSSFGSTDTLGSAGGHSTKTGTSAVTGTSTSTTETGVSRDSQGKSKHSSIRKKLKKPLEKLGLGSLAARANGEEGSLVGSSVSRGTSADGTRSLFRRSRQPSAVPADEDASRGSSLDAGPSPAQSPEDAPASTDTEPPSSALSAKSAKSVQEIYEHHPETRVPQMGDFVQA
ncbi:CRAL-TRIO domain-containing protein [Fomitopsis serialis]|uniref:CRAL-TRIO domain-containing protein n=1 Tax=Fomitopsis serialis TaxID=139415 RepID=UPI002007D6D9|nr:CRAL-TRIO domain-containing protein [Neoantrodia serialis]KAH9936279.1 CRAL-TRIO domain-containing protein [Neoantrodia serialis]